MNARSLLSIVCLAAVAVLAPAGHAQSGRSVGDFFPDVELPTIDGKETLRLSDFRGQKLLLIEFASW